jgi:hypothetical protein
VWKDNLGGAQKTASRKESYLKEVSEGGEMRVWGVNPKLMCNQHLLGEHVEIHMFVGTINKGRSIQGYIAKGLVEPDKLAKRHIQLVAEMVARGMRHRSELPRIKHRNVQQGHVDIQKNKVELSKRCIRCRKRLQLF